VIILLKEKFFCTPVINYGEKERECCDSIKVQQAAVTYKMTAEDILFFDFLGKAPTSVEIGLSLKRIFSDVNQSNPTGPISLRLHDSDHEVTSIMEVEQMCRNQTRAFLFVLHRALVRLTELSLDKKKGDDIEEARSLIFLFTVSQKDSEIYNCIFDVRTRALADTEEFAKTDLSALIGTNYLACEFGEKSIETHIQVVTWALSHGDLSRLKEEEIDYIDEIFGAPHLFPLLQALLPAVIDTDFIIFSARFFSNFVIRFDISHFPLLFSLFCSFPQKFHLLLFSLRDSILKVKSTKESRDENLQNLLALMMK